MKGGKTRKMKKSTSKLAELFMILILISTAMVSSHSIWICYGTSGTNVSQANQLGAYGVADDQYLIDMDNAAWPTIAYDTACTSYSPSTAPWGPA